jgi:hypothetical protein
LSVAVVLWDGGADSHGSISAVDTLHFGQSAIPFAFVTESNESVSARLSRHWVGHDFRRLAGLISNLEEGNEHVFSDFGAEITDKDAEFGTSVVTTVLETSTAGPV